MIPLERQSVLSREISAADSRVGILSALQRVASEFAFAHLTVLEAPKSDDPLLAPLIVESSLPDDYFREFDRLRLLRRSSMMARLSESAIPICWSIDDQVDELDLPREMIDLQRRYGIPTHLAMGLTSVDGTRFALHFAGARATPRQVEINELAMLSLQAFDVFDKFRRAATSAPSGILSSRELEVVRWTAQGKTSVEIGRILSLSDHTVNAYMTNAIKKLDCVNRTQLVAKAIRLKLIV
jgi:DNA-binding CsgD family transcriptional regulator